MHTFAEVVDVSHPFPRLSFAFHDNVLDFGVGRGYQQLRAEEADTAENFDGFCQEPGMKHGLGQVQMAEMTRAFSHAA